MAYFMASLVKKIIRGNAYYYARQSQRVNGKPKIVRQVYLGRADDIVAKLQQAASAPKPQATVRDFGAVAALFDLARRLRLAEIIDRHLPKRGPGPSVGTYLLVAVLNRCLDPCSKSALAAWFQRTVLDRLLPLQPSQLSSQRFWDNMDRVSPDAIQAIERDLVAAMVRDFRVDLRHLLFDATNFFTFIDTFNDKPTLAQRGHSKEGRASLRIVGLALLVSADSHLPLLHATYPGNRPDAPTFQDLCSRLTERCRAITDSLESITLVFDKGNNSKANLAAVETSPFHFIGSLVPTHYPDLLATPPDQLRDLASDGLPGVRARRAIRTLYGIKRTLVVTYNENLYAAQTETLRRLIATRDRHLSDLAAQLGRWRDGKVSGGRPPSLQGVTGKVNGWLRARHMRDLFSVQIGEEDDLPTLAYDFNQAAWQDLRATLLGKTLLFTDNHDWSDADIVRGYRAQHHIEGAFRQMKRPHRIALRPQYHWTDQKIEVHVFCCVLALLLTSLLQRDLRRHGLQRSLDALFEQLGAIREVGLLHPPHGSHRKPRLQRVLSTLSEDQRALYEALDLKRYMDS